MCVKGSGFISRLYCSSSHSRRSGADHTVLHTYINLHKLFTLHCNFICVLSVVIIKTDDDDDDEFYLQITR